MAEFLFNKLLFLHSPPLPLPLYSTLSPQHPFPSFSSLRRLRFSLSSQPTPPRLDIISTSEHSDGSIVFKFGDASEIQPSVDKVDDVGEGVSETVEQSNDVNSDEVKENLETLDSEVDASDVKGKEIGSLDDDCDVNDAVSLNANFDGGNVVSDTAIDVDEGKDVDDEKLEVEGRIDGDNGVNDVKAEVEGDLERKNDDIGMITTLDTESVVKDKLEDDSIVNGTTTSVNEVDDVTTVESDVKGTVDVANEVNDAEVEGAPENQGNVTGTMPTLDDNSELTDKSDGETIVDDMGSDVNGGNDITNTKLEVEGVVNVENDVNDVKAEVEVASQRRNDVIGTVTTLDAKSGVNEKLDGESVNDDTTNNIDGGNDAIDTKLEVQGTLLGKHEVVDAKKVKKETSETKDEINGTIQTLDGKGDVDDSSSKVQETIYGVTEVDDAKADVEGTSENETVVIGMISTADDKRDVDVTNSEVLETIAGGSDSVSVVDGEIEIGGDAVAFDVQEILTDEVDSSVSGSIVDNKNDVKDTEVAACGIPEVENGVIATISTSYGDNDVKDVDKDVLEALDHGNDVDHVNSEVGAILNGQQEVMLEEESGISSAQSSSVTDAGVPEVSGRDDTKVKDSVDTENESEAAVIMSSNQEEVLENSRGDTDGALVGFWDDVQTDSQSSGDSVNDKHNNDSCLTNVTDSSDSLKGMNDIGVDSLSTASDSGVYMAIKNSSNSEVMIPDAGFGGSGPCESSETLITEYSAEVDDKIGVAVLSSFQDDEKSVTSDLKSSEAEDNVVDSNFGSSVSEGDVLVEPTQPLGQLEAEPVADEETSSTTMDDFKALESSLDINKVHDSDQTDGQSSGDPHDSYVSETGSSEASGPTLIETYPDSMSSMEVPAPAVVLSLISAAVSLPHPSQALTGGEDAYFVCQNWIGVADGVGHWSFGGINRGQYAQELMENCEKLALQRKDDQSINIKEILKECARMTQSVGSARAILGHIDDKMFHVANIGDSGFIIIRNGTVFKKSTPMFHEFNFPYAIGSGDDDLPEDIEEYHIEVEDGDVIITATDALFDNLYEQEIASIVSKAGAEEMEPKELAELLAGITQEVGRSESAITPFAEAAQAAGHPGFTGGKLDHVTVIASLVKLR